MCCLVGLVVRAHVEIGWLDVHMVLGWVGCLNVLELVTQLVEHANQHYQPGHTL